MYDDRPLRCPYCGGIHLFHKKRGFSFRNAFLGNMFLATMDFWPDFSATTAPKSRAVTAATLGRNSLAPKQNLATHSPHIPKKLLSLQIE